ncbi:uncharacterized protein VTP21DRAFT_7895 [Calcarisporiella thermophila]|uniref:uncharacterized protein n=1 Tax=Calcarisporiella thermophila TaxID=911321 RepID=UPI0037449753
MAPAKFSISSDVYHYVTWISFALVVLTSLARLLLDPSDRNGCTSLLEKGWWWDSSHTRWQPAGCTMHTYKPKDINRCVGNKRILFIGDSVIREKYYGLLRKFDPNVSTLAEKRTDLKHEMEGVRTEFWWDPFLNNTKTIDLFRQRGEKSAVVVIGSGLWYLRHPESGGFESWQQAMMRAIGHVAGPHSSPIADVTMVAPVEVPVYDKLNKIRKETLSPKDIDAMNAFLWERRGILEILFSWNEMIKEHPEDTKDGLHYELLPAISISQADIVLNYRCNDHLPKIAPMQSTCCFQYPIPTWNQIVMFLVILVWAPIGLYFLQSDIPNSNSSIVATISKFFPSEAVLQSFLSFGLTVTFMFLCDRTNLFLKQSKHFSSTEISAVALALVGAGVLTLRTSEKEDQPFLNRDQTEEWKGWMQLAILIYHYWGASSVSGIYNPIRVLVAAYLFMTGYGHFTYFYKTGNFGFKRVAQVLVRLNLLTVALVYTMNTTYLSYYFTPLVSFWFLVIYASMGVFSHLNKRTPFLLLKLGVASALVYALIYVPNVIETLFTGMKFVFNTEWSASEWRFRLGLDIWIVWVGMVVALACIKFSEYKIGEQPYFPRVKRGLIGVSIIVLVWFAWFELSFPSKFEYNKFHPLVSFLPILAFVVLRNATPYLRRTNSTAYCFIGKCSLETFIGQFHMWLAGDTKALLVLTPSSHGIWWWINFFVASGIFIYLSHYLATSTGELTEWICGGGKRQQGQQKIAAGNGVRMGLLNGDGAPQDATDEEKEGAGRQSIFGLILGDWRGKTILFLMGIAIVNRFC